MTSFGSTKFYFRFWKITFQYETFSQLFTWWSYISVENYFGKITWTEKTSQTTYFTSTLPNTKYPFFITEDIATTPSGANCCAQSQNNKHGKLDVIWYNWTSLTTTKQKCCAKVQERMGIVRIPPSLKRISLDLITSLIDLKIHEPTISCTTKKMIYPQFLKMHKNNQVNFKNFELFMAMRTFLLQQVFIVNLSQDLI